MTRKLLTEAVEKAAAKCGMRFHAGFAYRIASEVKKFPALWLEPAEVVATDGRREGVRVYGLKMMLMAMPEGRKSAAKETAWQALEDAAQSIRLTLAEDDCVRDVAGFVCTPSETSLTAAGEVSLAVAIKVAVPFSENCWV
ncbi:hypothetical protein LJC45_00885 [Alistipes sp. OttesenSCG-928-B03]|nr:hypothetical protein [Alistipes sp. OttesenSCG-928-B03]